MKKLYKKPLCHVIHIDNVNLICTSSYGPNSEVIPFEGEEDDEEIYHPSRARGIWDE